MVRMSERLECIELKWRHASHCAEMHIIYTYDYTYEYYTRILLEQYIHGTMHAGFISKASLQTYIYVIYAISRYIKIQRLRVIL